MLVFSELTFEVSNQKMQYLIIEKQCVCVYIATNAEYIFLTGCT